MLWFQQGRIQYDTEGHSFYEGDWVNNKRHGYGVRRYHSGNVYEGEWANNNRHGQGVMRWVDIDQSYSGQWEHGVQVGTKLSGSTSIKILEEKGAREHYRRQKS